MEPFLIKKFLMFGFTVILCEVSITVKQPARNIVLQVFLMIFKFYKIYITYDLVWLLKKSNLV